MTSGLSEKQVYGGIDIIKFICAILIVAMHLAPFQEFSSAVTVGIGEYIARTAVPFFFAASGFLLFRKTSVDDFSSRPSFEFAKKILRLFGLWMILYCSVNPYHLWYMGAVCIAVFCITLLLCLKVPLKAVCALSCFLYIFGLLGNPYYEIMRKFKGIPVLGLVRKFFDTYFRTFETVRNGVFMGMIFVCIGILFAYSPLKLGMKKAVIGYISSMAFLLGEVIVIRHWELSRNFCDMYIFLPPVTYFMFAIALNIKTAKDFTALRAIGSFTYFSHVLFRAWMQRFVKALCKWGLPRFVDGNLTVFILTLSLCLLLGYAVYRLSKTKKFYWLSLLYS